MVRICPNRWDEVYSRLIQYAKTHDCTPPLPPKILILSGWGYTNDIEKKRRWEETITWATNNGCAEIVNDIPDSDFYCVDEPTTYAIGPMGGPMYRSCDYNEKDCPSSKLIQKSLELLLDRWPVIAGKELSKITRPLKFTGSKARRLLVQYESGTLPPWGGWECLSKDESKRRSFTQLRAAVNEAIAPHGVDHIGFVVKNSWPNNNK